MRWTSNALRQAREYLSGVSTQLREDIGPEFDDLRAPLSELQKLRGMTPRAALTKHLLDGDDSIFTGNFNRPVHPVNGAPATPAGSPAVAEQPATPERPCQTPFDTDAT